MERHVGAINSYSRYDEKEKEQTGHEERKAVQPQRSGYKYFYLYAPCRKISKIGRSELLTVVRIFFLAQGVVFGLVDHPSLCKVNK
jgi:hypothetical protein